MKNWLDISLEKFYKIQDLLGEPDEYTTFNILDLIYDIDSSSMTISEFRKYSNALEFLKEDIPEVKLKKEYTLNGKVYNSNFDLTMINIAQFMDYLNYIKKEHPKYEEVLSVFFTPSGHSYNDGEYSIVETIKDLRSLPVTVVMSAAFFFDRQFRIFLTLFQYYLKKMVKKLKIEKSQKKELLTKIEDLDLTNLGYYLTYLNTLK